MDDLAILLGIVGTLGILANVCRNLQGRFEWLTGIWIILAVTVAIVALYVVVTLVVHLFSKPMEDQPKVPEKPQATVSKRSDASAAPEAKATAPRMETRELPVNFGSTNDHCAGPRDVRWHVPAKKGWKIDVTSIQVKPTVISSKSSYSGVTDATKDGFYIVGRIVNRGNCVKAFGKVVARDARGTLRVSGTYQETRQVVQELPSQRATAPRMETRELPVNFGSTNDHCAGPRDVRWHVPAKEGWKIDVTSIQVKPTVISSKSSYSGVTDATKDGFYIVGRIVNRGNCVKAFGKVVARDARGTLRVSGTYQEIRQVVQERSSD